MGNNNRWLKARKRHQILIAKIQRIAGGSLIAALIVGPLIYFSVIAMPLEMREPEGPAFSDIAATQAVGIAEAPEQETELRLSASPIPLPEEDTRTTKILNKSKIEDLNLNPETEKFEKKTDEPITSSGGNLPEEEETKIKSFFDDEDAKVKQVTIGKETLQFDALTEKEIPTLDTKTPNENRENKILVLEDLEIKDGPKNISNNDEAEKAADKALQQYLRSELKLTDFRIFNDTSIIDKNKKPYQFVLSTIKNNNEKWYITYDQYSNGLPVFDGDIKLIITDKKELLTVSDNIKRDLPDESEFKIGKAVVTENVKEVFEWDDDIDEITFIDKGYFKGKPAYKATTEAHNPLGEWEIFIEGVEGNIEDMTADIRLQDIPATPEIDSGSTLQPTLAGTQEPEIQILDALFSQILGTIYPNTPNDSLATEPFSDAYTYTDTAQFTTDEQGFFENENMDWYSTFLDGPNVTVYDDDATANIEIVNQTPEDPFVWDENSASLAAINAFYHTNKIHDYFANNLNYEIGKDIPLTVNSNLVDAYIDGCGAWFNNSEKTIEMGRGGGAGCPAELNYALGSDFVYHEYTHFIVEDVTNLPYILGSETAAMSEGLSDYFAATINDDPVWGDVIAPSRRRNLENTLNYQTDMTGESHHDGMIFSGALWDLREEIGAEATDQLVFNTLFQDRYHFETFMYGMIIEDDDNGDFSDGTPHLAEIITAFDNHGIGPGIANFDGLPLTPEAWTELLGEEVPEGEEEELLGGYVGGGCGVSGSTLTVTGTCAIYDYQYFQTINVQSGGSLWISWAGYGTGGYNELRTYYLTIADGGKLYVGKKGSDNGPSHLYVYSGGYIHNSGLIQVVDDPNDNYILSYGAYTGYTTSLLQVFNDNTLASRRTRLTSASIEGNAEIEVGGREYIIGFPSYWQDVQGILEIFNSLSMNDGSTVSVALDNTADEASQLIMGSSLFMYDSAELVNDVGGSVDIGDGVVMRDATHIDNKDAFDIYDDLTMSNEISGATAIFDNSGAVTATSSTSNTFSVLNDCTFNNLSGGTVDVYTGAGSSDDGVIKVFETADWDNTGTLDATRIEIGDLASTGGYFYNRSGASTTVYNCGSGIRIYRGSVDNQTGASTFNSICGLISISGASGDPGIFKTYANSNGRFSVEGYADMTIYSGATHTASSGRVQEAGDGRDGTVTINSGGTLNATTMDVGYDLYSGRAGVIHAYGELIGTTLNILEDSGSGGAGDYSAPGDDYELEIYTGGFVHPTTINLGSSSDNGGEILNRGGDGVQIESDGSDEGISAAINIYSSGTIFNGGDRNGGLLNSNAEVNHEQTLAHVTSIYPAGSVNNNGYYGGGIGTVNTAPADQKIFSNKANGKVKDALIAIGDSGVFQNGSSSVHTASVQSTQSNYYISVAGSGRFDNHGDTDVDLLIVGNSSYPGGTLNLDSGGSFNVTNTGTTAARVLYTGDVNVNSGSSGLDVAGTLSVADTSGSGHSVVNINQGAGLSTFGAVSVGERGIINAYTSAEIDDSGGISGNLNIGGTTSANGGKVLIANVIPAPSLIVDGTTTISEYGTLENNSYVGGAPYTGFYAHDLVTVEANGTIISDGNSDFTFLNGITSAGTVEIDDNIDADDNSTSGYSIEVTGGTFTNGLSTNTGTTNAQNVMISGGTFTTYNDAKYLNVDVTGTGTVANFEESGSPVSCANDIHGYFDITSDATATINCTTGDAVYVHSGSPGGNVLVDDATLNINTNLTTETMEVTGTDVSNKGTVTHEPMDLGDDPLKTFVLTVTDTLNIQQYGELNVDSKANYVCPTGTGVRGGSHGGVGQYPATSTPSDIYDDAQNPDAYTFGCSGKWYLNDSVAAPGGGIMHIIVGTASGDPLVEPTGSLINNGSISANGGNWVEGAGSGGSIVFKIKNTITGSGPISADGGGSSGALPLYSDTAGGGGRIHMAYYDKSGYTGTVSAVGGRGAGNLGSYAGTGTIFYLWTDEWRNQNDGTLVIDSFDQAIDVNLDSTFDAYDATQLTDAIDVESVQVENSSYFWLKRASYVQQCILEPGSYYTANNGPVYMNRDTYHTTINAVNNCFATPDPPSYLHAEHSLVGAQSGRLGAKFISPAIQMPDLTPAISAIHEDGALDSTEETITPTHKAYEYQLILSDSVSNVWSDNALPNCNIDTTTFPGSYTYPDGVRVGSYASDTDIIIPDTCAANLSSGNTYYWKIRFMEDQDANDLTTGDQFWGLWSETNRFDVIDGGVIQVGDCSAATINPPSIDLGNTPSPPGASSAIIDLPNDTFDEEMCEIELESTMGIDIHAMKNQLLTHETYSGPGNTLADMPAGESSLSDNVGIYVDALSSGLHAVQDQDNLVWTDTPWHQLRTGSTPTIYNKIVDSSTAIINGTFELWFGADIGLDTISGVYSAQGTVTLVDPNP